MVRLNPKLAGYVASEIRVDREQLERVVGNVLDVLRSVNTES